MKNYLLAIATLAGTVIGVGIFALPYVINQSGIIFLPVYMIILGVIQHYLHLLFAEVVLSTNGYHRLPGYVAEYSNKRNKYLALAISMLSDYGIIIVYIIVGGLFLHQLLGPFFGGSIFLYSTMLFIIESLIVFFGLRLIAGAEFIMSLFLLTVIGLIAWHGWDYYNLANYSMLNLRNAFLPYGPVFFAIGGMAAIPEVCRLLARNKEKIRSAIFWGTFVPLLATSFFVVVILGMMGNGVTPDTLSDLGLIFQDGIITLALIFGLLAIITSFLTISQSLREAFWWDFKINKALAWALSCLVPYFLYLAGWRNLTKTVSITGALAGGIFGIVLIWLVFKIKKQGNKKSVIKNKINLPIAYGLSLLFILGFIYELWAVLFK